MPRTMFSRLPYTYPQQPTLHLLAVYPILILASLPYTFSEQPTLHRLAAYPTPSLDICP
jgi:hypothetical protein